MVVQEMTEAECLGTLARTRLGRPACSHEGQPYVVPVYFVCEHPFLYGFTTPGQKVEWMRANPLVCVELDEVVDNSHWTSFVVFGRYEELTDRQDGDDRVDWRGHAHELLRPAAEWWEPGSASHALGNPGRPWEAVYYRIGRVGGRRAAGADGFVITQRYKTLGVTADKPFPPDLLAKLPHGLFIDQERDKEMHPSESLASGLLANDGESSVEPNKVVLKSRGRA